MPAEMMVEEIRRLRRENDQLKRQRDILKKAALILGEGPQ
jgi:transposase-like protein